MMTQVQSANGPIRTVVTAAPVETPAPTETPTPAPTKEPSPSPTEEPTHQPTPTPVNPPREDQDPELDPVPSYCPLRENALEAFTLPAR
jgi:hypothetical protein